MGQLSGLRVDFLLVVREVAVVGVAVGLGLIAIAVFVDNSVEGTTFSVLLFQEVLLV